MTCFLHPHYASDKWLTPEQRSPLRTPALPLWVSCKAFCLIINSGARSQRCRKTHNRWKDVFVFFFLFTHLSTILNNLFVISVWKYRLSFVEKWFPKKGFWDGLLLDWFPGSSVWKLLVNLVGNVAWLWVKPQIRGWACWESSVMHSTAKKNPKKHGLCYLSNIFFASFPYRDGTFCNLSFPSYGIITHLEWEVSNQK